MLQIAQLICKCNLRYSDHKILRIVILKGISVNTKSLKEIWHGIKRNKNSKSRLNQYLCDGSKNWMRWRMGKEAVTYYIYLTD